MNRRDSTLILLAFLAFVSLGLPDTLLGVAWPSIRAPEPLGFALPLDSLGLLAGCGIAGYFTSSFFAGGIIDRFGVAALLVGSGAIVVASLTLYATSPIWPGLLVAAVLAGLGAGAIDAGVNTFAARAFSPRVLNWLHACWGVGATLGPIIMTTAIAEWRSWRAGYATVAVLIAALSVVFFLTRKLWRVDAAAADANATPATLAEAFREPIIRAHLAFYFLYCFVEAGAGAWIATLLIDSRGLSIAAAGTVVSCYWGSLTLGRFGFGQAASKFGAATVLRVGLIGSVVGCALLAPGLPRPVTIAGIALLGLSLAPIFPTAIALTPARVGDRLAARAVGMQIAAAGLGMASGPALVGVLARHVGIEALSPTLFLAAVALPMIDAFVRRAAASSPQPPLPLEAARQPTV